MKITLRGFLAYALTYLAVAFLVSPLIAAVPVSFTAKRYLSMPEGDWSWLHYQELFTSDIWRNGIFTSIQAGIVTSVISTVLAFLFAVGLWYTQSRLTRTLVALALVPMAVPPIVSSLTMYFFSTQADIYDSMLGVVIAHTVMALPYAVVTILVSINQVDRRIELAARNLGASVWQTTFWVILPNVKFGVLSAAFLSFILSWEEISVTLFVTSVDVVTLPKLMWSGLRDSIDPVIAAIAVILTVIASVCVLVRGDSRQVG
ncbi:ABC transporter permease [Ensifer sp. SSB1]|uniref:ABC transporter permease n=1 Tax=Ensifer sp. SSB1 TaxID=2795385 RepID=UPI001A45181F|nr:ABC transporter permease [Ensifer sp. SSB1]MBK5571107.1 ABC transporter permease [Ensifer sp. SSB1]